MVLKELILTVSTLGSEVVVLKEVILNIFLFWEGSGGLERGDFNSFCFGSVLWS